MSEQRNGIKPYVWLIDDHVDGVRNIDKAVYDLADNIVKSMKLPSIPIINYKQLKTQLMDKKP